MAKRNTTDNGEVLANVFTALQLAFIELYSDPDSDTWSNALRSAERAGYAQPKSAASKAMRNSDVHRAINARVRELVAESLFSPDIVKVNLLRTARRAEAKGDLSTAARCHELLGKTWGLFLEKTLALQEKPERARELTQAEAGLARRAALLCFDTTGYVLEGGNGNGTGDNTDAKDERSNIPLNEGQKQCCG